MRSWPAPARDAALHGVAGEFVTHKRSAFRADTDQKTAAASAPRNIRGRSEEELPLVAVIIRQFKQVAVCEQGFDELGDLVSLLVIKTGQPD